MTAKENLNKYYLAALKGGIGAIPGGSLVVELLNVTIPDRRLERIEKLLMILASKELDMDSEEIKQKFHSPEFTDIFEDVIHQAVRALSDERLEYLASIVEYGLRHEEIEHLHIKRLLEILKEINDVEIIILQSYGLKNNNRKSQKNSQQQSNVFDVSGLSAEKASEHKAMFKNYNSNLINLGLIGVSHSFSRYGNNLYITKLGLMLLEKIGLKFNENVLIGEPIDSFDAITDAFYRLDQKEREVRKEIESATQKATRAIESDIRKFESDIRRRSGRYF